MKRLNTILILLIIALLAAGSMHARERKKPLKAYLSGARIAIVEGRPEEAIYLIDTLFMHYGHHAEALSTRYRVYVDLMEGASTLDDKRPYVKKMVAYIDTLHMVCQNEEINENYRKDCDEYLDQADSTKTKYWRDYYRRGHQQLGTVQELSQDLQNETDSTSRAFIDKNLNVNIDSVIANMNMALLIDSTDASPYIAIGNAFEFKGDYRNAIEWMVKGLDKAKKKSGLLLPIAYNYINMGEYCGAIPYFKEYTELNPDDTGNLINLSICYNNCEMYDSALFVYRQLLDLDPTNVDILRNVGLYFNTQARIASDSANLYRAQEDTAAVKRWEEERRAAFDSARTYFKTAFELAPQDLLIAEQYGFVSALLEDCEQAITGFKRVTELNPDDAGNWISLGDCYKRLAQFEEAMQAYEKVAELQPENLDIWLNLKDLYQFLKKPEKLKKAEQKVEELQQG